MYLWQSVPFFLFSRIRVSGEPLLPAIGEDVRQFEKSWVNSQDQVLRRLPGLDAQAGHAGQQADQRPAHQDVR